MQFILNDSIQDFPLFMKEKLWINNEFTLMHRAT